MEKDFNRWNDTKIKIDVSPKTTVFKEREIWWCSIGINVGHEENGKGDKFNRPILIIKKFNKRLFWGIPLTTQIKDNIHYHGFTFNNKSQCAMLTQLRLWDATRLNNRMGQLGKKEFQNIREDIKSYLQ